jgi:NifB/MoaA-like Fe-S oxidoreductase
MNGKRKKLRREKRVVCICGTSAKGVMERVCADADGQIEGLQARPLSIVNDFFGPTVTCTGLLTGADILKALLKEKGTYDEVVLPCNTLREFTEDFLDGMTITELKEKSGVENIVVNRDGGFGLVEIFCKEEREKSELKTGKKGKQVLYERKYKK